MVCIYHASKPLVHIHSLMAGLTASPVSAVNSVLAIGGVGGLAVGLAGREILENLFTGLIILSSSPFEVGDEVCFSPPNGQVSPFTPACLVASFLLKGDWTLYACHCWAGAWLTKH